MQGRVSFICVTHWHI
uniref:Uncharacterized protein n=1 Tax=Anguilla anguilla TaxID=7936 RepID=A0A0E9TFU8_ANGAN